MSARTTGLILFLSVSSVLLQSPIAQDFVRIDDERYIQLALDMIRKGVQQEDTAKVFAVFAPEIQVDDGKAVSKASLNQRLQTLFDASSRRNLKLERPPFPRADNPLRSSNYWDFDILEPRITIRKDSAFVDCLLVLWGSSIGAGGKGRKVPERLVFISPRSVDPKPPPENTERWPSQPIFSRTPVNSKGWILVQYNVLLDFLEDEVKQSEGASENSKGASE